MKSRKSTTAVRFRVLPPLFREAKKCPAEASAKADKTLEPTDSTATSEKNQGPVAPQENTANGGAKKSAQRSIAYLNYATKASLERTGHLPKIGETHPLDPDLTATHQPHVRLRSKSVTVQPVVNPTGSISYRVMGTIRPKAPQRKQNFLQLEDALATQAAWESERIMNGAAVRPKITRLTQAELAQAEAAVEMLRGTGITLIEATRFFLRQPAPTPASLVSRKAVEAHGEFLAERRAFVGNCQYENLRLAGENFFVFVGADTLLADVTSKQVVAWLKSKGEIKKKTWNNYRNDLSTFFEWCAASPRRWIADNPVKEVPQHEILAALPE